MYQLKISADAQIELEDSVLWYKERSKIATTGFTIALKNTFERILANPKSFQNPFEDFYQVHLQQYPFTVVYTIEDNEETILVESIFHQSRNPKDKFK
jgi:plasmid stabilization system protein ParE